MPKTGGRRRGSAETDDTHCSWVQPIQTVNTAVKAAGRLAAATVPGNHDTALGVHPQARGIATNINKRVSNMATPKKY